MSSPAAKGSNVLYIAHNSQARARGRRWLSPQRKFCGLSFASDSNPSAQPQNYVSCVFVKCLNSESLFIPICKNGDDFGELGWPSSLYCMLGCTLNLHLGVAFSQPGSSLFVVLSVVSRSLGRPAGFHNNVLCGLSSWFWNISKHNAHRFELLRKREQLPCTMQCINSHNHRDQRCMRQQRHSQPLKPRALNTYHNNNYKFPKMWTNYALWPTFSTYRSTPTSLGHARRYFIYTLLQWDGESSGGRFKRQEREKCDASGRLIHQIFSSLSQQSELCDDAIPPTRVAIIETD